MKDSLSKEEIDRISKEGAKDQRENPSKVDWDKLHLEALKRIGKKP